MKKVTSVRINAELIEKAKQRKIKLSKVMEEALRKELKEKCPKCGR